MSSKTDVLSFDDALNKHKRLLTESLVNFDERQRVRKILLEIDSNSADYEYYFQSGQQSKQAEVDELQKRVYDALNHAINHGGYDDLTHIINILKGEQAK